ncbi:hypothetical protein [Roseovarius sp. MMSF_3281]|uniref:hypothetical protein n=1 Tax=Roseovarius sp. MMSF_3281 TaxID=3046694 RepID=UPI00273E02FF|nr:hypothetical protein [Roseovarius sp. MMSF_3281]
MLTILAGYELIVKDRALPYASANFNMCGADQVAAYGDQGFASFQEFFSALHETREGVIFLDVTFSHLCLDELMSLREIDYDDGGYQNLDLVQQVVWSGFHGPRKPGVGFELNEGERRATLYKDPELLMLSLSEGALNIGTEIKFSHLRDKALSRYYVAETETSVERLRGVFFVSSVRDAGYDQTRLLPVGYSDGLWAKYNCSHGLSRGDGTLDLIGRYWRHCLRGVQVPFLPE